jgi:hypothetical protein
METMSTVCHIAVAPCPASVLEAKAPTDFPINA